MIIDFNPTAKLVLCCDDGYLNCRYEPAPEGTPEVIDVPLQYVKQAHYVCRSVAQGLTVHTRPMLEGWQRYAELQKWARNHIV